MLGSYAGMLSFDIKGGEQEHLKFLNSLRLISHAVSLGDAESLIVYTDKYGEKIKYYPELYAGGFFRFSVGLEDAEDILNDLKQALDKCGI
ncbi:PLP-dependent transferase [Lachnospiraceae bacterium NSJ-143]|nr:PLP-dependent transferase [Lachnospiraceae bacterium NSJ-143]